MLDDHSNNDKANTSDPDYPNPTYSWYVVVILFLAFTVAYIDRQIMSLLVEPMKADLGISDSQIGLLQGFAFTIFYTFAGIPLGRLADKKNRKVIIATGMFLWSIMTAVCGLAKSFTGLFIARIGVGVGEACLSPAANSMITDYFPKNKRSKPVALYFMGVYVGVGLAYILGGLVVEMVSNADQIILPLVGEIRPWQLTFILVSIPGLLLVVLMATVKEPFRHGLMVAKGKEVDLSLSAATDFFKLHKKAYLSIFFGFGLSGSMAIGFFSWIPAMFTRIHGWEVSDIGYAFGIIVMVMGTLGIILAGVIADYLLEKGHEDAYIKIAIWAALGAMIFGSAAVTVDNPYLALALLCPTVACFGMPVSLAPAAVNYMTPNQFRGQAIAIYVFVVGFISNTIGPFSAGFLNDYVFKDEMALDRSLVTLAIVFGLASMFALKLSIKHYTKSAKQILAMDNSK